MERLQALSVVDWFFLFILLVIVGGGFMYGGYVAKRPYGNLKNNLPRNKH